jgi:hypothetical protein
MVIAMAGMGMVQAAIDEVIDMIAMRHRFMATAGAVHMAAIVRAGAAIGVADADADDMFIDMVTMHMVQMAVVQIIDMAIMLHGGVAATGAVLVGVIGMGVAGHGKAPLSRWQVVTGCVHTLPFGRAVPVNSGQ